MWRYIAQKKNTDPVAISFSVSLFLVIIGPRYGFNAVIFEDSGCHMFAYVIVIFATIHPYICEVDFQLLDSFFHKRCQLFP
jgi:hypothetical protein